MRRDSIRLSLGKLVGAQLMRRRDASEQWLPERGVVAVGASPLMPEGFDVVVALPEFDADFWRGAFAGKRGRLRRRRPRGRWRHQSFDAGPGAVAHAVADTLRPPLPRRRPACPQHRRQLAADAGLARANGEAQYDPFGRGALRPAEQLTLEPPARGDIQEPAAVAGDSVDDELPALDVVAENFSVGEKKFGRVEVQAHFEAANWRIEKLSITNPDGRLDGTGLWRMQPPRQFALDFKLATEDSGALLALWLSRRAQARHRDAGRQAELGRHAGAHRLPDPDRRDADRRRTRTVRQARPRRRRQAARPDQPAEPAAADHARFSGDVFSEGFAYDSITGKTEVKAGVMHTDRLQIDGPSARVLMRGDVDLQNETQKLVVNVPAGAGRHGRAGRGGDQPDRRCGDAAGALDSGRIR